MGVVGEGEGREDKHHNLRGAIKEKPQIILYDVSLYSSFLNSVKESAQLVQI